MPYRTKDIVIVGGGSAGWMTAATIVSLFPDKNITLIESPSIPTVGVGESTLGQFRKWMTTIGLQEEEFITECDASYKMSIKFTNFYSKDSGSFHYPFGEVSFDQNNQFPINEWFAKKYLYPDTPVQDYVRHAYDQAPLIEHCRFDDNSNGDFGTFNPRRDVAYHFDATKFANWLREKYSKPRGVNHIRLSVSKVNVNDDGIESLVLEDGTEIKSDLYIDCTGFESLLLGQSLKEPFTSYSDILPNNRAWATKIKYKDRDKELEPFTECTAIDNGWVWNIPCWSRIGTGYVYSDEFISKEDALDEFKEYLKTKKGITSPDKLKYKDIEMRIGIHERTWVKNVVAIGLSAGFIEPLESNGLFTVHEFLLKLCKSLKYEYVNRLHTDLYNRNVRGMFDFLASFISTHYALSVRTDTKYWNKLSSMHYDEEKLFPEAFMLPQLGSVEQDPNLGWNPGSSGLHCICTGMNYIPTDKISHDFWCFVYDGMGEALPSYIQSILQNKNQQHEYRTQRALSSPTLNQYLKQKYYGNN